MAPKVTSSGNRSGRKPNKPPVVTSSKGRGNRSSVSNAQVSTGSNGKPQGGSARVTNSAQRTSTGSAPVSGRPPASLPPGAPRPVRPSIGNVGGPASTPKPPGTNAALKPKGSFKAPSVAKPVASAATKASTTGLAGRVLLPLAIASQVADVADGFNRLANHPFITKNRDKPVSKDANNRSSTGIRLSDKDNRRDVVSVPTGSQEYNDFRRKQIEAEKARLRNVGNPPARAASPAAASSSSSRSGGGGGGGSSARSTPAARPAQAQAKPGRKFEDFNPNRGTSKTNNPLMKDFVARMKDREDKAQASAASKLTIKSNVESGYEPKEKVDGSKVNAKGKIRSTVNEYDPKKRRYGG